MLPEGCWYCFENSGADPLVVLRIAAVMPEKGDPDERHGIHGEQIDSHTAANKRPQETVFRDGEFYE
jgi:hypothetical protein